MVVPTRRQAVTASIIGVTGPTFVNDALNPQSEVADAFM
jgi:hypothetical protein